MHAEARIAPIVLTFPPEVIESVVAYTNDRSVEPATLIPLLDHLPSDAIGLLRATLCLGRPLTTQTILCAKSRLCWTTNASRALTA